MSGIKTLYEHIKTAQKERKTLRRVTPDQIIQSVRDKYPAAGSAYSTFADNEKADLSKNPILKAVSKGMNIDNQEQQMSDFASRARKGTQYNKGVGASIPKAGPVSGEGESSSLLGLLGKNVGRPVNELTGGRLGKAMEALGAGADRPDLQEEALGAGIAAGAAGGAAGLGALKIRGAAKARAAAQAAKAAPAAAPAAGRAAQMGKLLQKLITKRASVMSKVAHLEELDRAATDRAMEMMKIAQEMAEQGEELTFDDVMNLSNPEGDNFLEGLVTDLAMAKLEENGFVE